MVALHKKQLLLHYYSIIAIVEPQYYLLHKIVLKLNAKFGRDTASISPLENLTANYLVIYGNKTGILENNTDLHDIIV